MSWPACWQANTWQTRLLSPLGKMVCAVAQRRWQRAQVRFMPTYPTAVCVVVGNLTVGGSGKTPLLMRLGQALAEKGVPYGIVSRGYGGRAAHYPLIVEDETSPQAAGDEPVMLKRSLKVPAVVAPNRPSAVSALLAAYPDVRVILSDDGLQHHALPRDIEVVVTDGVRGFGNGQCMPAGPLREPLSRLEEIDFKICHGAPEDMRLQNWPQMHLKPVAWRMLTGERLALETFRGQKVAALAGIGHPGRFLQTLQALGIEVVHWVPLSDHAAPSEIEKALKAHRGTWLMTQKDAVKCSQQPDCYWLEVEAQLPEAWLRRWVEAVQQRLKEKYEP